MKNRLFAILLAAVTVFAAACSGNEGAATTTAAPAETTEATTAATTEAATTQAQTTAPADTTAAESKDGKVASGDETIASDDVVDENMQPIPAASLKEGTYDITVASSSSMFKVEGAVIEVKDGKIGVTMTMGGSGNSYLYLFAGTAEEAAAAAEADLIALNEEADGTYNFKFEIDALNKALPFAAFSKNKEKWYDRNLAFRADTLPAEAFADGYFVTAASLGLADGEYTVEATLSGGSGRTSVESPAKLTVKDGAATVTLVWSSSKYDYMLVDGMKYEPLTLDPGSTFEIPVMAFDYALPVIGDTTAMSQPYEIEYTLFLDSATVKGAQQ